MASSRSWSAHAMPRVRRLLAQQAVTSFAEWRQIERNGMKPRAYDEDMFLRRLVMEEAAALGFPAAEMYWVRPNMAMAAMDASADIPTFCAGVEMPCTSGVMGFEEPLPPLDPDLPLGLEDGTWSREPRPVDLITWNLNAPARTVFIQGWVRDEHWGDGPKTGSKIGLHPVISLAASIDGLLETDDLPQQVRAFGSFVGSAWVLMRSPGVVDTTELTVPESTSKKKAKKRAKQREPDTVTLADLRSLPHKEATSEDAGDGTRRTLQHRFLVRGHWRQQAVGPGRRDRKLTWISSFVKGPADAPFKATDRVFTWRH